MLHVLFRLMASISRREPLSAEQVALGVETAHAQLDAIMGENLPHEASVRWMLGRILMEDPNTEPYAICEQLECVLDIVERMRAQNTNPRTRASFVASFPHLYDILCGYQLRAGRIEQAFRTIESSKGRFVADHVPDAELYEFELESFAQRLRELAPGPTSYLTALTGRDEVFLILVTPTAEPRPQRIPVKALLPAGTPADRSALETFVSLAGDREWRKKRLGLGKPPTDFRATLSPLVSWLSPSDLGEHLAFCPDGALYNVPLHGLPFRDAPLGSIVTVSRVHGMQSVLRILEQPAVRPERFLGFLAQTVKNLH